MRKNSPRVLARGLGACLVLAAARTVALGAEVSLPPFYEAVTKLKPEGKLGKVIASEEVKTSVPNAAAWRIAYISSDVRERPTISTALVVAPKGRPPKGGRPIVSWAHGTTGTAENCGPSQVENPAQPLNQYFLVGGTSWTDFGIPALREFLDDGYVIVATDYQGLGGGGRHQYAISASQGRDAINAIRAAGSMNLSGGNKKAAIYGWSQGGGATLAAASLPEYINKTGTAFDGVEIVGFAALAPHDVAATAPKGPVDEAAADKMVAELTQMFSSDPFNFTHFAMSMWANAAAFPELKMTDIFTDEGAQVLDEVFSKKCVHAGSDTLKFTYGDNFKMLLKTHPGNGLAWARGLVEGSVQPVKPAAPVIIYWGTKDTVVTPVMGQLYREQMCKLGANVARVQLPGEQSHFTTPKAAEPMYLAWIKDRLSGRPLPNGCE